MQSSRQLFCSRPRWCQCGSVEIGAVVVFVIANAAGDGRRNAAKQPARARRIKKNAESPPPSLDPFIVVVVSAIVAAVGERSQLACHLFARARNCLGGARAGRLFRRVFTAAKLFAHGHYNGGGRCL